jgi:hypothetical protein
VTPGEVIAARKLFADMLFAVSQYAESLEAISGRHEELTKSAQCAVSRSHIS